MSNDSRRTINRAEAQLAWGMVATALDLKLDLEDLTELAEHTRDVKGMQTAVVVMRKAALRHDPNDIILGVVGATLSDYNRTLGGVH